MSDEMTAATHTPASLSASLHALRPSRAQVRLPIRSEDAAFKASVETLQQAVTALNEPAPVPQPVPAPSPRRPEGQLDQEALLEARLEAMTERFERTIRELAIEANAALITQARTAERAEVRLDEALSRSVRASPETIAMLESENKRHLSEIQSLQNQLERERRAMRLIVGPNSMKPLYRSMGKNFSEISENALDLLDAAPNLAAGELSPELGRRIAAFIRTSAETIGEYADNCSAYAEDNDA